MSSNESRASNSSKYIIGVDVGTTNLKCHIYNSKAEIIGESTLKLDCIYPRPGWVEIDPFELWEYFTKVVKMALEASKVPASSILSMGISTQRSTLMTWDRHTGRPYHNFIAWSDVRSDTLCREWNQSLSLKIIRCFSWIMYRISGNYRYLSAHVYTLKTQMVASKLLWIFKNIPMTLENSQKGHLVMGTVDTWLLWNLTGGKTHATDESACCVSGLYDTYQRKWSDLLLWLFKIPKSILPTVLDTSGPFGTSMSHIFGYPIRITAMVGDQQASMFGECCFNVGNVKCTMGTGSFLNTNTGKRPHASFNEMYPVVGWTLQGKTTYLAEGGSNDTGTAIGWAQKLGFFDCVSETSELARSVPNSGGLYFIPAFFGIQAPINDNTATCAFIGIQVTTTKAHMVRSILESLAFLVKEMFDILDNETNYNLNVLRVNGGVAGNDFIMQLIADLTGITVERPMHKDMSCLGAAYLAGLAVKYWSSLDELTSLRKVEKLFIPAHNLHLQDIRIEWRRALDRCLFWTARES